MKLVADEGVDGKIVERLRQRGHDVTYVAELAPGIEDDLVLSKAHAADALLLTSDKDFGELVFRLGRRSSGVLLLRFAGLSSEMKAEAVAATIERHGSELLHGFAVLSPGGLRLRKQP